MLAFLLVSLVLLAGTGIVGLVHRLGPSRSVLVYGMAATLSAVQLVSLIAHRLAGAPIEQLVLPIGLPWLGMHFRLDALSTTFLLVVTLVGGLVSLFAVGYGRNEPEPARVLPFYALFLAAMQLVCLADDAFTFLLAWEAMSLASFFLVLVEYRRTASQEAAWLYLVMAVAGTTALLLAMGLLAGPEGSYTFDSMRARTLDPSLGMLVLALVLTGAGSKAGLVPLHAWLPLAHPAAPSHVSALMSGVMTKVAIYGFLRLAFDLLPTPGVVMSLVVLIIGGVTAVMGVLYALMEHDLKRLLAYHTVENIGIIVAAIGLAMAFEASHLPMLAALALSAGLFHVLNHALFKSLLFCGAGAVLHATGTRDMEALGGLVRRMPVTGAVFLLGCAAISALPPLNGFASEWLLFQAILQSPVLPHLPMKFVVPAVGALLALAAALAAACFVKAYGVVFLGRPRSAAADRAHEVDRWSRAAMIGFAGSCLLFGILPGLAIDGLAPASMLLLAAHLPAQLADPWLSLRPIAGGTSSYNGLVLFSFLLAAGGITALLVHRLGGAGLRRGPVWDCGYPDPAPSTQYTAASFAQPIRRVFGTTLFRARESVAMPPPLDPSPAILQVRLEDPLWQRLYLPVGRLVASSADRLNPIQFQTIRRYLVLVFLLLVGLLLLTAGGR